MASWSLACDFLFHYGGAEKVVATLASQVLPEAKLYYIGGDPQVVADVAGATLTRPVIHRRLTNERNYRHLAPMYPQILERVTPVEGNLLVSSYAFAHLIPNTGRKLVYCHSPLRQVWSGRSDYSRGISKHKRLLLNPVQRYLRGVDRKFAQRADGYIATSRAVRDRIERFYGIPDAPIIPPPIETTRYRFEEWHPPEQRDDYYLFVGRLVEPYKRVGLAIDAFRDMPDRRLIVAGDGRDRSLLEGGAPANVTFLGWRSGDALAQLYRGARGLIFPSTDDFGIVPVEATASGTPVICYAEGGALDTVRPNETGIFFTELSSRSLRFAIRRAEATNWDRRAFKVQAQKFAPGVFRDRMLTALAEID